MIVERRARQKSSVHAEDSAGGDGWRERGDSEVRAGSGMKVAVRRGVLEGVSNLFSRRAHQLYRIGRAFAGLAHIDETPPSP